MRAAAARIARRLYPVLGALAALPSLAASPPLGDAKEYVAQIYRRILGDFDYRTIRYSPELAELFRRDDAFSRQSGDVGAIDAVPFCGCQDTDANYRVLHIAATAVAGGGAIVSVLLRNGPDQRFTINLDYRGGSWWISDIHARETPSLLALLRREVPREEAQAARHSR